MKYNFDQPQNERKDIEQITDYVFKGTVPDESKIAHQPLKGRENVADKEAEDFFKAINPNGYLLSDIQAQLNSEINQKKSNLEAITGSDLYSNEEKNSIVVSTNFQIRDLEKWVNYIEFYLSSTSPEPIKELKKRIAEDNIVIDEAVKNQKPELN